MQRKSKLAEPTSGEERRAPFPSENHLCVECGFSYAGADDASATLRRAVRELRSAVEGATFDHRRRAAPDAWSVIEYVCHVRDVLVTSTVRLHRVVREREPLLEPMYNDWRAKRFRYRDEDEHAVLDQIDRALAGLLDEVATVPEDAWHKTGGRLPEESRPARWFVRHAAHEVTHHVLDIRRACDIH